MFFSPADAKRYFCHVVLYFHQKVFVSHLLTFRCLSVNVQPNKRKHIITSKMLLSQSTTHFYRPKLRTPKVVNGWAFCVTQM